MACKPGLHIHDTAPSASPVLNQDSGRRIVNLLQQSVHPYRPVMDTQTASPRRFQIFCVRYHLVVNDYDHWVNHQYIPRAHVCAEQRTPSSALSMWPYTCPRVRGAKSTWTRGVLRRDHVPTCARSKVPVGEASNPHTQAPTYVCEKQNMCGGSRTKSKTCVVVAGPHGPSSAGNRTSPGDRVTWDAHATTTQSPILLRSIPMPTPRIPCTWRHSRIWLLWCRLSGGTPRAHACVKAKHVWW